MQTKVVFIDFGKQIENCGKNLQAWDKSLPCLHSYDALEELSNKLDIEPLIITNSDDLYEFAFGNKNINVVFGGVNGGAIVSHFATVASGDMNVMTTMDFIQLPEGAETEEEFVNHLEKSGVEFFDTSEELEQKLEIPHL